MSRRHRQCIELCAITRCTDSVMSMAFVSRTTFDEERKQAKRQKYMALYQIDWRRWTCRGVGAQL